jgi:hypothetical protein
LDIDGEKSAFHPWEAYMRGRNRIGRVGMAVLLGVTAVSLASGVTADDRDRDGRGNGCDREHGRECGSRRGCGDWKAPGTYQLADVPLSGFLRETLPALGPVDDHGIDLGGIGSDLWRDRDDCAGEYWMLTDRGPNGENPRTFPVLEFTPHILRVRTCDGRIEALDAIPITGKHGSRDGVTGLANADNTVGPRALNEPFFGCNGLDPLSPNANGIDSEGLVRTSKGTFWVCEEYGPSILKIDKHGRVKDRFLPTGLTAHLPGPFDYPVDDSADSIPAIYGLTRKLNRGFEGLTLSPDERTLYVALQSPLSNPTTAVGNASRVTRILAFDLEKERVVAEYAYRFQATGPGNADDEFDVPSLGTTGRARSQDMKLSGLAMVDEHRMLVLERTDFKAKVYRVDLRTATNILDTKWDDVATTPSLETLNADGALEGAGVVPLPKTFVVEMDSTAGFPRKIEGITIVDDRTIAIANDNDFGVGTFGGAGCTLSDTGIESLIQVIRLARSLKD